MKFKVGDIVTGKQGSIYGVTNQTMTKGEVVSVGEFRGEQVLDIKILEHLNPKNNNEIYDNMYAKHFNLVSQAKPLQEKLNYTLEYDNKLKGTFITINEKYILFVDVTPQEIGISSLNEAVSPVEVAKALALYRAK
jgi:hypothetical protein